MTHKNVTYKSKAAAVVLCLCLGTLGAHRFYLGHPWLGIMWPVLTLLSIPLGVTLIVGLLLIADALILLFRGSSYYKRIKSVEVEA